jgi:hypothetical protein
MVMEPMNPWMRTALRNQLAARASLEVPSLSDTQGVEMSLRRAMAQNITQFSQLSSLPTMISAQRGKNFITALTQCMNNALCRFSYPLLLPDNVLNIAAAFEALLAIALTPRQVYTREAALRMKVVTIATLNYFFTGEQTLFNPDPEAMLAATTRSRKLTALDALVDTWGDHWVARPVVDNDRYYPAYRRGVVRYSWGEWANMWEPGATPPNGRIQMLRRVLETIRTADPRDFRAYRGNVITTRGVLGIASFLSEQLLKAERLMWFFDSLLEQYMLYPLCFPTDRDDLPFMPAEVDWEPWWLVSAVVLSDVDQMVRPIYVREVGAFIQYRMLEDILHVFLTLMAQFVELHSARWVVTRKKRYKYARELVLTRFESIGMGAFLPELTAGELQVAVWPALMERHRTTLERYEICRDFYMASLPNMDLCVEVYFDPTGVLGVVGAPPQYLQVPPFATTFTASHIAEELVDDLTKEELYQRNAEGTLGRLFNNFTNRGRVLRIRGIPFKVRFERMLPPFVTPDALTFGPEGVADTLRFGEVVVPYMTSDDAIRLNTTSLTSYKVQWLIRWDPARPEPWFEVSTPSAFYANHTRRVRYMTDDYLEVSPTDMLKMQVVRQMPGALGGMRFDMH